MEDTQPAADRAPAEASAVSQIPANLAPMFQEYRLSEIDPDAHAPLVIERVLALGDRRELRWLFDRYGKRRIAAWLRSPAARRLPYRRQNLWSVLLGASVPDRASTRALWPH